MRAGEDICATIGMNIHSGKDSLIEFIKNNRMIGMNVHSEKIGSK